MKYLVCQKASKIGVIPASQFPLVVSLNWWAVPASTIRAYSKFGGSSSPPISLISEKRRLYRALKEEHLIRPVVKSIDALLLGLFQVTG
jgi:hypothetical protein